MNYEIEKAIKQHANEKELYLATCVIVQDEGLATDLWFLYANEEDARRWLDLCREYHKATQSAFELTTDERRKLVFSYGNEPRFTESYKIRKVK